MFFRSEFQLSISSLYNHKKRMSRYHLHVNKGLVSLKFSRGSL